MGTLHSAAMMAAMRLPFELAGGVRVGIDGEPAARIDCRPQQGRWWVESLGPAVDLDGCAELGTRTEHPLHVEGRRLALVDHPTGAVTQDVHMRRRDGAHHPLRHVVVVHSQFGMHTRYNNVKLCKHIVAVVECPVFEDVNLDAGQHAKRRQRSVEFSNLGELLFEALLAQPMGDRQTGRMIREHDVLMTQRDSRASHCLRSCPTVAPATVEVTVTAQRVAVSRTLRCDRYTRFAVKTVEIGSFTVERFADHAGGGVTDTVEPGERLGRAPPHQLIGIGGAHDLQRARERLRLETTDVSAIETVHHPFERFDGCHRDRNDNPSNEPDLRQSSM